MKLYFEYELNEKYVNANYYMKPQFNRFDINDDAVYIQGFLTKCPIKIGSLELYLNDERFCDDKDDCMRINYLTGKFELKLGKREDGVSYFNVEAVR